MKNSHFILQFWIQLSSVLGRRSYSIEGNDQIGD